jgi:hypothetical protein
MLVETLPAVAEEEVFALKGGTAINLFLLDLPRLSVDIDLTYLGTEDHAAAQIEIDRALRRIRNRLAGGPAAFAVQLGAADSATGLVDTLAVKRGGMDVKIEVNPVLRGALSRPELRDIRPAAEEHFGFIRARVLAFEDVYAGKLVAALDRQHPRDLFDVKLLFDNAGITDDLFRAFLVYLVGHKGSIAQTIDPRPKDLAPLLDRQLRNMVIGAVTLDELIETRARLLREIHSRLGDDERRFLVSVKRMAPEWELVGLQAAADLPAVRWKLHNLGKMNPARRAAAVANLEQVLDGITAKR